LLRVQDDERRRFARELHDHLGQELVALKMMLENDACERQQQRKECLQILDRTVQTVRNISYLLHPPLLDEAGLLPALSWYVEGLQERSGIKIALNVRPTTFPRLSRDIETTIFRILQEALTNIYRHSESKTARVELERQQDCVLIKIRDYGKGVPAAIVGSRPTATMGVGINGMRERVKQFGGDLLIRAAEPGTLLEVTLPLIPLPNDDSVL